jgi:hypothetical protein
MSLPDRGRSSTGWYQLQVAPPLDIDPSTRVGQHPFDFEPERDRCPRGDTLALNLISDSGCSRRAWTPST